MNRITVKYTSPPGNQSGTVGYRGQDEYSRKWIDRMMGVVVVPDNHVPNLLRIAGTDAHTVEVLPLRETPLKAPECEEF